MEGKRAGTPGGGRVITVKNLTHFLMRMHGMRQAICSEGVETLEATLRGGGGDNKGGGG